MLRLLLALTAAFFMAVPAAFADGDPPSDILVGEDVYYGYRVDLRAKAAAQLPALLAASRERGYELKVALVPSPREYNRLFGLDREKLSLASRNVRVMHPGPMNRGVEIDSDVADDLAVSLVQNQVEMGVAARMAVLASMSARLENE